MKKKENKLDEFNVDNWKLVKLKEFKEIIKNLTLDEFTNEKFIEELREIQLVVGDFFSMIKASRIPIKLK